MDTNILLESGTNELEVLEFTLGDNYYGINVAKIREILTYQQVTPVPNAHPCVEGIFMPRDTMMTVIDLKKCLGMEPSEKKGLFIITNFNKLNIAFHVDEVIGIHRVSWEDIIKPDSTINTEDKSAATGLPIHTLFFVFLRSLRLMHSKLRSSTICSLRSTIRHFC